MTVARHDKEFETNRGHHAAPCAYMKVWQTVWAVLLALLAIVAPLLVAHLNQQAAQTRAVVAGIEARVAKQENTTQDVARGLAQMEARITTHLQYIGKDIEQLKDEVKQLSRKQ